MEGVAMKAIIRCTAALLASLTVCSLAGADPYYSPVFHTPLPPAPDTCGPGFYAACPNGMIYGPNYWLRPSWAPYNGPAASMPQANFPFHPYVRGPRDFFMWQENMQDQLHRNQRPALLP
jgi:hypothetical protein